MQKVYLKLIFIFVLLCNTCFVFSQNSTKRIVKLGYVPNYGVIADPYIVGKEGFGFELFKEISRYTNYTFEFVPVLWNEGFSLLDSGEIDIFGPASYSKTRAESYIYTNGPIGYEDILLVTLKDSDYYFADYESFDNSVIGIIKNNIYEPDLRNYLQKNKIKAEIVYIDKNTIEEDLRNGLYDIALTTSLGTSKNLKIIDEIGKEPFYYIGSTSSQDVIEEINRVSKIIQQDNSIFFETLYIKYFLNNPDIAQNALSKSEMELLQSKDKYFVGYNPSHNPLSYQNQLRMPKGIAIEVMDEIARIGNITIEYVPLDENNTKNKSLDFNLNVVGKELTTDDFATVPYMDISLVAIINKNSTNKIYKTLAMLNYNSIDLGAIENLYPNAIILETNSMDENLDLLQNNTVDGIIVSSLVANSLFDSVYLDKYSMQFLGITIPFSITVSNDLPLEVLDTIDKIIEGIDSNFVQEIILNNAALFDDGKTTLAEIFYKYRFHLSFSILLVALFFTTIIIIITKKKRNELYRIRNIDSLTGLMTSSRFFTETKKMLKNANPKEFMLCSIDIDNFKQINKLNGYDIGNKVLIQFSKNIRRNFGEDALIARETNDIFIVFAKFSEEQTILCGRNDDCDECINHGYKDLFNNNLSVSISEGFFIIDNPFEDVSYMLDCTHTARLEGKQTFGKTTHVFTEELLRRQLTKNTIESLMEAALKNNEFFTVLQPKYALLTGEIIGAEALIRWRPRSGKTIYPDEFITIFENNGFIKKIDFYIFEKVCELLATSITYLKTISVNLSGVTALTENLADKYIDIANKYGIKPSQIEIELTESAFVINSKKVRKNLEDLKKYGFNLSIDDFGIGVSSLSRLKDMNVDELKLDRSFISSNLLSDKGISILKNVIALSKDLHLSVVAEGIETDEQMNILLSLGCDIGQGYYFSKPLEIEDFIQLYEKNNSANSIDKDKILKTGKLLKKIEDTNKLHSGVIICKNDQYFTIISANEEAYKILGYSRQDMISLHRNRFLTIIQGDSAAIAQSIKELRKGKSNTLHIEFKIKRKNDQLLTRNFIMYDTVNDVFTFSIMDNSLNTKDYDKQVKMSKKCSLTNLYNSYGIESIYNDLSSDASTCMFLINISGIGAINKKYSEEDGNFVLKQIADILQAEFLDASIIGRIEGNRFIVLFKEIITKETIEMYIEKIVQRVNYSYEDIPLSCFIGVGYDSDGKKSFESLYECAQKALQSAKQDIQNSFRIEE